MSQHLMLVPSLACPASCAYCFGPHAGGKAMGRETLHAVVEWQRGMSAAPSDGDDEAFAGGGEARDTAPHGNGRLEITFHGGEPLVAGAGWYRAALPLLREGLTPRRTRFAVQSNLWLLTDELCELFREHRVSLGTSLDGPEAINDAQRGAGYFARTMAGIERARAHGLGVGAICTFTEQSIGHAEEIFDFFVREGLNFSVHAALPSLRYPEADRWSITPEAHGELLVGLLDRYLANLTRIRISTLDSMARSVGTGRGGICTFGDCLGGYLAVGPDGAIYPCQRFAGMPEFVVGNVARRPSLDELRQSPVWRTFRAREEHVQEACGDCASYGSCKGGCPYNALVGADGRLGATARDPHCGAYRRAFETITNRAMAEVFSPENLDAVVARPDPQRGLMRRGRLLSIMRDGPHPYETAGHARRVLASVALAATGSPAEAAGRFEALGLAANRRRVEAAMTSLHARLTRPPSGLNNLYLHVTFACNLRCSHCYADAGPQRSGSISVPDLAAACREGARLGFGHAVITGGEPLVHPDRDSLLDTLAGLRAEVKPLMTVLRTALAVPLGEALLARLSRSTDQVVVSVDGDRETHDARRGRGTYELTVANLRALAAAGGDTEISLATVLPLGLVSGPAGDSVRALARELGVRRTRFRPLLPLGRAAESDLDIVPETLWGHVGPEDMLAYGFSPVPSCGIGQNLYVEPDLAAYPCYAWHGEGWRLGSIGGGDGLDRMIASDAFRALGAHTVNTNRACRECAVRYLCGGACRAWNRVASDSQVDLDAPPVDCGALHARARSLLRSALDHLGITPGEWLAAALPLPDGPPLVPD
jgi:uncharacterized protein